MMKTNQNIYLTDEQSQTASSQAIPADTNWGIDTVRLSFPVLLSQCDLSSSIWLKDGSTFDRETGKDIETYSGLLPLANANVQVRLDAIGQRCSLEFNAARVVYGKSLRLLPPAALIHLVDRLLTELRDIVFPAFDMNHESGEVERSADWHQDVRISRLDLARNFMVDRCQQNLKQVLEKVKPHYGKTKVTYSDESGGWTLVNSTKSNGQDRIYDKSAELLKHDIEEKLTEDGTWFRFETQLVRSRLRHSGLGQLGRVTDALAWRTIKERWGACRWGVTIPEPGTLETALAVLDPKTQMKLVGYLFMSSLGTDVLLPRQYRARMKKLADSLGLVKGLRLYEQGVGKLHLDLHSGRLVETPTLKSSKKAIPPGLTTRH